MSSLKIVYDKIKAKVEMIPQAIADYVLEENLSSDYEDTESMASSETSSIVKLDELEEFEVIEVSCKNYEEEAEEFKIVVHEMQQQEEEEYESDIEKLEQYEISDAEEIQQIEEDEDTLVNDVEEVQEQEEIVEEEYDFEVVQQVEDSKELTVISNTENNEEADFLLYQDPLADFMEKAYQQEQVEEEAHDLEELQQVEVPTISNYLQKLNNENEEMQRFCLYTSLHNSFYPFSPSNNTNLDLLDTWGQFGKCLLDHLKDPKMKCEYHCSANFDKASFYNFIKKTICAAPEQTILSVALTYAGTKNWEILKMLSEACDTLDYLDLKIESTLALAYAFVGVGSGNTDCTQIILDMICKCNRFEMQDTYVLNMIFGIAMLQFNNTKKSYKMKRKINERKELGKSVKDFLKFVIDNCAYGGSGNLQHMKNLHYKLRDYMKTKDLSQIENPLELCQMKKYLNTAFTCDFAIIGYAVIGMDWKLGETNDQLLDTIEDFSNAKEPHIRRTIPLAMGLLSAGKASMKIYQRLLYYLNDVDPQVAQNATFAIALNGAGSMNETFLKTLNELKHHRHYDPYGLGIVELSIGLIRLGNGQLKVSAYKKENGKLCKKSVVSLFATIMSFMDAETFIPIYGLRTLFPAIQLVD